MNIATRTLRGDFIVAAALLILALLLGGGSALFPLPRLIVELAGVAALAWFLARGWRVPLDRPVVWSLVIIAGVVLLVVLQITPLPPGVWRSLPGRTNAATILDIIGAHDAWMPLSLDPAATREAGYFLVPPIAMFAATLHLDRAEQTRLLFLVACVGLLSALLVMVQSQGLAWLTLYQTAHTGNGQGIFANKNHNAVLLVLSIPLVAMFGQRAMGFQVPRTQRIVSGILILVLTLAVFGCLSRAGLALLPFALLACLPLLGGNAFLRQNLKLVAFSVVAVLIAAYFVAQSGIVKEMIGRFNSDQEGRFVFWPDVVFTIRQFMPWGSGIGTFVPAFQIYESLDAVRPTYTNHAHSDYLEIALETGIWGILLLFAFISWFITRCRRVSQGWRECDDVAVLFLSMLGVVMLMAASIVDYPLRTLSLACVFSVLLAILASPESQTPVVVGDGPDYPA